MRLTSDPVDAAGLEARVFQRLDARLSVDAAHPLALALSGGGDSMALLGLAGAWARTRGRRLLALTVDHRLNSASAAWTVFAGDAARAAGADWRALAWDGPKPETGVTAAARRARHALIAEAARAAGARVVLFAHTADDAAEADWMRERGSTLGRVRAWSPSPAWPEGRGLILFRPLLEERRAALRDWLAAQQVGWIEDPANADPRFGRSRARQALAGGGQPAEIPPLAAEPSRLHGLGHGMVEGDRALSPRALAAALVCVGGGDRPPRLERLEALVRRLRGGEDFVATLAGARLEAAGRRVRMMREAGEQARRDVRPMALPLGRAMIWDGRVRFLAREDGLRVRPARGLLASLSPDDRAVIATLPAGARGAAPVLIRDGLRGPVLASPAVDRAELVPERLRLALDETTHEDDLNPADDGVTPWNDLFSRTEHPDRRLDPGRRTTEDLNEPA